MTSRPRVDPSFLHSDLTDRIIGGFYRAYDPLGFGFLEIVYRNALAKVLRDLGIPFEREAPIDVFFEGEQIGHFKADFLVDKRVILEIKSAESVGEPDFKQLMNYLRSTQVEVGLLLNFGSKPTIVRRVYSNHNKGTNKSVDR